MQHALEWVDMIAYIQCLKSLNLIMLIINKMKWKGAGRDSNIIVWDGD